MENNSSAKETFYSKCVGHNSKVEYICISAECLKQNKFALCPRCYILHTNDHKPQHSSIVTSSFLVNEIQDILHLHERKLHQLIRETEDIYEQTIKKMTHILTESWNLHLVTYYLIVIENIKAPPSILRNTSPATLPFMSNLSLFG